MRGYQKTMFENKHPCKPETTAASALQTGFFRSVGLAFKGNKLGDLLVASNLITPQQLESALTQQKTTGKPLGSILIHQKALTAVQLYHKLAEQWCLRIAATGVTVLMQTSLPLPAQADEVDGSTSNVNAQFTLAAATAHAEIRNYPELFGTTEVRHDDITAFKKWTNVMRRFQRQLNSDAATSPEMIAWNAEIERLQNASDREKIDGINTFLNKVPYIEDIDNYGKRDYWATPVEFLTRGGDCEDYAIAKYASLRALGFTADQLRIAIVTDKVKNIPHAILVVYSDEGNFVLDNQNKATLPITAVNRYEPIFSLNSKSWWLHHA